MSVGESVEGLARKTELPFAPHGAWLQLALLLILSAFTIMAQMKIAPIQPLVMDAFNMNIAAVGWLTSAFSLVGMTISLIAGSIIAKKGARFALVIASAAIALGALLGAVSTGAVALMAGRVLEGIGAGLVFVGVPSAIAEWFPGKHRGLAMGIWSADMPLGAIIILVSGPAIASVAGWRAELWFVAIVSAVAFLLVLLFYRSPDTANTTTPAVDHTQGASPTGVLRNRNLWLLAAVFFLQNLCIAGAVMIYYPTFLVEHRGIELTIAGTLTAVNAFGMMIFGPIAGAAVDRLGATNILRWGVAGTVACLALSFAVEAVPLILLFSFLIGVASAALPASIYTLVPDVVEDARLVGPAMGVLGVMRGLGSLLGPVLMGSLVLVLGWMPAASVIVVLMATGLAAGFGLSSGQARQHPPV